MYFLKATHSNKRIISTAQSVLGAMGSLLVFITVSQAQGTSGGSMVPQGSGTGTSGQTGIGQNGTSQSGTTGNGQNGTSGPVGMNRQGINGVMSRLTIAEQRTLTQAMAKLTLEERRVMMKALGAQNSNGPANVTRGLGGGSGTNGLGTGSGAGTGGSSTGSNGNGTSTGSGSSSRTPVPPSR